MRSRIGWKAIDRLCRIAMLIGIRNSGFSWEIGNQPTTMADNISASVHRPHFCPVCTELTASYDACGSTIGSLAAQHAVQQLMKLDGCRSPPRVTIRQESKQDDMDVI